MSPDPHDDGNKDPDKRTAEQRKSDDELIDECSEESFPTSDPPSFSPVRVGSPKR